MKSSPSATLRAQLVGGHDQRFRLYHNVLFHRFSDKLFILIHSRVELIISFLGFSALVETLRGEWTREEGYWRIDS